MKYEVALKEREEVFYADGTRKDTSIKLILKNTEDVQALLNLLALNVENIDDISININFMKE